MVVGFDATHDTANKTRSFGATVCSLNKLYTQYYSAVNAHNTGEELSNSIALHIVGKFYISLFNNVGGRFFFLI